MYKNEDFIQLVIREKPRKRYVWLKCLKATAALYGWDKNFKTLIATKTEASTNGWIHCPGRKGWKNGGGTIHRISQSETTSGWPKGTTHTFRLSKDATTKDLARVAQATEIDWHWITTVYGERLKREWLDQAPVT